MGEQIPPGGVPLVAAVAAAVVLMEEDDDDSFKLLMNVANIAVLEWMAFDGDGEIGLEQLQTWQHVTVNIQDYHLFNDFSFRLHFRMSRVLFERLVQIVGNHLVERGRLIRNKVPLQDKLLMVRWILATPDTFRSVALRFGVNPGGLYLHYKLIIQALRELGDRFINWPNREERNRIKGAFLRVSGFPGIVGSIDCTHVYIPRPVNHGAQHRNRHHSYSLNVQAVVDNNLLVRDLYVGEVGSMSDKRVFRRSILCRDIVQGRGRLDVNDEHLVGDGGYTLADFMLIPFANNGHLTPAQINFNRCLSQCRVRVENAFGLAKGKWRRLKMLPHRNMHVIVDHIASSFVLHNFLILNGVELLPEEDLRRPINDDEILGDEEFEDEDVDDDELDGNYNELLEAANVRGQEKRIMIMDALNA